MNITFYELSNYNNGDLLAHTFDLNAYDTYEEFDIARTEWLEELTAATGALCEEYITSYDLLPIDQRFSQE